MMTCCEKYGKMISLFDGSGIIVPPKTVSNVPGIAVSNMPPVAETNVPPSVVTSRSFFRNHDYLYGVKPQQ